MNDYLFDSGILILHLRNQPGYLELTDRLADEAVVYISVISRFEIVRGMRNREKVSTFVLLNSLESLAVTNEIADHAGEMVRSWKVRGRMLDDADALIASTAIIHELSLVTTNPKHFSMPDLTVLQADAGGKLTPYEAL
ncbi:MAG: type II toxin-antitoxin system VapC family toxin [Anaerolineae bacterium]|nr:type II toxin-antitoxin system VapC family toxin [Anaerolineae bacterium]MDK1119398.1 type II toxin-antitoxin system VapC family toxin [Anaerolineae bacterium]